MESQQQNKGVVSFDQQYDVLFYQKTHRDSTQIRIQGGWNQSVYGSSHLVKFSCSEPVESWILSLPASDPW